MKVNRIGLRKKNDRYLETDVMSTGKLWQQTLQKSVDELKLVRSR